MKLLEKTNLLLLLASFTAIQLFNNISQFQPKLYVAIVIGLILWLFSLKIKCNKISKFFVFVITLVVIDSFFGFFPGLNMMSKAWIEQSTITTLAIFYSIYLVLGLREEKYLHIFYYVIIGLAFLILITSAYEFLYLNIQPGRMVTGYQNISSAVLLSALPLLMRLNNINLFIKLTALILFYLAIVILFKSRFSSVIGLIYILYLALFSKSFSWYYRLSLVFLSATAVIAGLYLTDRFSNLIYGNDFQVRLFIWERLISAGFNNFIFGSGFGNISILTSSWQFINPSIELITSFNTFHSAHNDLVEKFIYGGIVSVVISLCINFSILYGYFKNKKYELKTELIIYLILFSHSLIDIHNSNLASLILFNFFQFYLIFKIYEEGQLNVIYLKFLTIILLVPGFIFILNSNHFKDHVSHYKITANNMIAGNFNDSDLAKLDNMSPHFMRLDFIKMQTYLMYKSGQGFNKAIFEDKLLQTRKYNKYYVPQIHVSSQYYAFSGDKKNLLSIYSDLLYIKLVNSNLINISVGGDQVNVEVTESKNISMISSGKSTTLFIPKNLLEQLIRVNSSFGLHKLPNEFFQQDLNNFIYTGTGDKSKSKKAVVEFFETVNSFSDRFIFK